VAAKRGKTSTPAVCFAFWAVTELGMALVDLARRLGSAVSAVCLAGQSGLQLVDREKLTIAADINVKKEGRP